MAIWSPTTTPGRGKPRYGAIRIGLPADARYTTRTPALPGTACGRRVEFVAKHTTCTSGNWHARRTSSATPRSSAS